MRTVARHARFANGDEDDALVRSGLIENASSDGTADVIRRAAEAEPPIRDFREERIDRSPRDRPLAQRKRRHGLALPVAEASPNAPSTERRFAADATYSNNDSTSIRGGIGG